MRVDIEQNFVTLYLDNRTDTILLDVDEGQKLVDGLRQFADYAQYLKPIIKPLEEIWEVRFGLHDTGVALKFNKNTKKVRFPHKIALEVAKRLQEAINSYKNGYTIKLIHQK